VLLCSWTCNGRFCVITVSTVQLQIVQYLYSKCAVLLCSWTCSGSFCVITVSTVQLQIVQYLYSKCAVLLCSWTCSSSFCIITVSTIQLQTVQFVQYLYSKFAVRQHAEHDSHCVTLWAAVGSNIHSLLDSLSDFGKESYKYAFSCLRLFLSIHLHVTTVEILNAFSWNEIFLFFVKIPPIIPILFQI